MEIAARGWRRDAGKKTIISQDIREALPETNNTHEPDRLYIDPTVAGMVRLLVGPAALTLGGDYQIEVNASVDDIIRLLLTKFPDVKAALEPIFEKKEFRYRPRVRAATEHTDPESSYRRGYEHGAREALKAMTRITSRQRALLLVSEWVEILITEWRQHDRLDDRTVKPPTPAYDPQLKGKRLSKGHASNL